MTPWLVVGCGYVGSALARRLVAEGAQVVVTRRDAEAALATARAIDPEVRGVGYRFGSALAVPPSIVVCCAPPGEYPADEIAALVPVAHRLVYVSSTGVYAPGGGAWVDEGFSLAPVTRSGKDRIEAERALPGSAIALRVAGIHGPGRGLVDRIRAGTYRIVGDGSAFVSRIHVDDLVTAIVRAGTSELTGPVNIADDDPAPIGEVADTIAAQLGRPPPPRVSPSSVDPEVAGMLTANRRIANRRMKEQLGVGLRYPSWRTVPLG